MREREREREREDEREQQRKEEEKRKKRGVREILGGKDTQQPYMTMCKQSINQTTHHFSKPMVAILVAFHTSVDHNHVH